MEESVGLVCCWISCVTDARFIELNLLNSHRNKMVVQHYSKLQRKENPGSENMYLIYVKITSLFLYKK